ncbi:hypothetical protein BDA99DRAFT_555825 [Phascolomyces articulosus]|uniref:Uncharacterized protein n=1 Tax=Phascolomyces articulosus TaxID=60185 RepID=A0AAD5PIF5_9FUNG|nr:hypothetical protein BDA99DRAFT_555825 [Phascolomyces articulosus]
MDDFKEQQHNIGLQKVYIDIYRNVSSLFARHENFQLSALTRLYWWDGLEVYYTYHVGSSIIKQSPQLNFVSLKNFNKPLDIVFFDVLVDRGGRQLQHLKLSGPIDSNTTPLELCPGVTANGPVAFVKKLVETCIYFQELFLTDIRSVNAPSLQHICFPSKKQIYELIDFHFSNASDTSDSFRRLDNNPVSALKWYLEI